MINTLPALAGSVAVAAAGSLPALCPFRVWSGHACPLCGLTRAVQSLASGHVDTALRFHPLVLLIALEAAVLGVFFARTKKRPPAALARWMVGINLAALTAVWLVRWRLGLFSFVVS